MVIHGDIAGDITILQGCIADGNLKRRLLYERDVKIGAGVDEGKVQGKIMWEMTDKIGNRECSLCKRC